MRFCRQVLASGKEEAGQVLGLPTARCVGLHQRRWAGFFFFVVVVHLFFLQLVQWLFVASVAIVFISMSVDHTPQLILCQTLSSRLDRTLRTGLKLRGGK